MHSIFLVHLNGGTFIPHSDGKIFSYLQELPTNANYPDGGQMTKFLTLLHKYAANMYSTREIKTFLRENPSNVLIDKLISADVAYTILFYESYHEYWIEISKKKRDDNYVGNPVPKYHAKRGQKMNKIADGWTTDGRQYYKEISGEMKKMFARKGDETIF